MTTNNSIDSNIPIEISKGGTNTAHLSLTYGVMYYDGSSASTVSSLGASGQVLTSNGSSPPSFKGSVSPLVDGFSAQVSSTFTLTVGSATTVVWDDDIFNIGGNYDTGTGIFTAGVTDKFMLIARPIIGHTVYSSDVNVEIYIVTSNRTYSFTGRQSAWTPTFISNKHFPVLADMDSGDTAYVEITMYGSTDAFVYSAVTTPASPAHYTPTSVFEGFTIGT